MRSPDPAVLDSLVQRQVGDLGAAVTGALTVLGDHLGLFRAMADGVPRTAAAVAADTQLDPRYVQEWLAAQAAAGNVTYDPAAATFSLSAEQALVLADDTSPVFFAGAYDIVQAMWLDEPKVAAAFRSGDGVGWHEHSTCLFRGTERFFRPGYNANLIAHWLPAVPGLVARLTSGIRVADVGCGHGASTLIMAEAFPASQFVGFDYHAASIAVATEAAATANLAGRARFAVAAADQFPGADYGLVTMFDCLHDMGDPVGAGQHVRGALAPDGVWLIVEPFAGDRLEDNLNPVGRIYYGASTMLCTPSSRAQPVGLALGAQAGEQRLREVVTAAGFSQFDRVATTPFNLVFAARP